LQDTSSPVPLERSPGFEPHTEPEPADTAQEQPTTLQTRDLPERTFLVANDELERLRLLASWAPDNVYAAYGGRLPRV
jgi:hypothetical protein